MNDDLAFDWDDANREHIKRHGVLPSEAEQVIRNEPYDLTAELTDGEERLVSMGHTDAGRYLVVVTTMRGTLVRVITAFAARKRLVDLFVSQRAI